MDDSFEFLTQTGRAIQADWDNGDEVTVPAAVVPSSPAVIKDFLDEREAAMSSSELNDEEMRLREAVLSGIKAASSKKSEIIQDKADDGEDTTTKPKTETERGKSEPASAAGDGGEASKSSS